MKTCFKCHVEKDINEFYSHSAMADGHLGKCKECTKTDAKNHRDKNLERVRAYDRVRPHRVALLVNTNQGKKEWIGRNPEKRAAHIAVESAVKRGDLIKPSACEICGFPSTLSAHHADYTEPLIVVWLCGPCHKDVHRKSNQAYLNFLRAYESKDIPIDYRGDDISAAEEDYDRERGKVV
jgi:hypothetical protein